MLSKVVSTPNIISDQLKPFNDVTDDHISFMNTNTTTTRKVIMQLYGYILNIQSVQRHQLRVAKPRILLIPIFLINTFGIAEFNFIHS